MVRVSSYKATKLFVCFSIITNLTNTQVLSEEILHKKIKFEHNRIILSQDAEEKNKKNNDMQAEKTKNNSKIIWKEVIDENFERDKNPNWILIEEVETREELLKFNNKERKVFRNLKQLYKKDLNYNLLELSKAVPTAKTLKHGELRIEIGQTSPVDGGEANGTGNQNYSGTVRYGFTPDISTSIFYTEADDPLYKKINSVQVQPENLWTNYGLGLRWKIIDKEKYHFAIDTSIEQWRVRSGGCNGFGCRNASSNIFNSNNQAVDNNNFIGSISTPFSLIINSPIELTFAPKFVFLPETQGNQNGSGEFYGNNYGLAIGIKYKIADRASTFASSFIPLGPGNNSFDSNLNFQRNPIYAAGLNYSVDSKIALEGYITNSFGQTPATSILTLPSTNQIIYGARLIYTPTNMDNILLIEQDRAGSRLGTRGLTVSNSKTLKSGEKEFILGIDTSSSYALKTRIGFSELFTFDIVSELISSKITTNNEFESTYLDPGSQIIRGGGKAIFFSQARGDAITSGLRLSYGRVLSEGNRPGYMFAETTNSLDINEKITVNINPKLAWTGNGTPISLGASLNWKVLPWLELIPEANLAISKSETNMTLAARAHLSKNIYIDTFLSNSFSQIDMGQLFSREEIYYGMNLAYKF